MPAGVRAVYKFNAISPFRLTHVLTSFCEISARELLLLLFLHFRWKFDHVDGEASSPRQPNETKKKTFQYMGRKVTHVLKRFCEISSRELLLLFIFSPLQLGK